MIDAHVHVVCRDDEHFPLGPTGAGSDWWRTTGDAQSVLAALDASAVDHAVVVQAVGVYGYDCRCAWATVAGSDGRFVFVGAVDMDGDDPAAALGELAATTTLAGVRTFGVGAAGTAWLEDGRGDALWEAASELGTVVVPTIFTDRLPQLRALIDRHPAVTVALDHCGFPDMAPPERRDDLLALAELPALHLKVTSHNLHQADDPAAFLDRVVEVFGAHRLAWGSDHPQHQSLTYPQMVALARQACRHLSPDEQDAFLGGTSRRLWFEGATADAR